MTAAGVGKTPARALVNAVPDGEVQVVLPLHREGRVQTAQYVAWSAEIAGDQTMRPQDVDRGYGKQRSRDAVAAHIQKIDSEVILVEPVITERVSTE
jgi:hypothetical protein